MSEDPYKTLGVPRNASQEDIRTAYRKLAKKYHPDLNPGDAKAEEMFKLATAANNLLSDPEMRARFDKGEIDAAGHEQASRQSYREYADGSTGHRYGRAGSQSGAWTDEELNSIFGSMFNEGRGPAGEIRIRGRDQAYTLTVAFLDAVNGTTQRLTLPDGRVLNVKVPAGTSDKQVLRLRGQGGNGLNGGPNGDALIEIRITPHPFFERDGNNINIELPVSLTEAVLGGQVEVPTPGGQVRMRIPEHSDSGTRLRLRGKGVPDHGNQKAGDLNVKLRVVVGTPDAALKEFLQNWEPEHRLNPRQEMENRS